MPEAKLRWQRRRRDAAISVRQVIDAAMLAPNSERQAKLQDLPLARRPELREEDDTRSLAIECTETIAAAGSELWGRRTAARRAVEVPQRLSASTVS